MALLSHIPYPSAGTITACAMFRFINLSICPTAQAESFVYDWSANQEYRFENLMCVDANGGLIWAAKLPENTGPDCFVAVTAVGNTIHASTWSCHALTLDSKSGKTLTCTFTR
jgi:outer membrane protein assembly factor BamB